MNEAELRAAIAKARTELGRAEQMLNDGMKFLASGWLGDAARTIAPLQAACTALATQEVVAK